MLGLHRRTDPLDPLRAHLAVAESLWREILAELHARGAGIRESGAFLLASRDVEWTPADPPTVVAAAYYDDLDASCLTGGITMSGAAYDRLWQRCREDRLRVVADVHTHPGDWVAQSSIDRANPMMALAGHLALIVGNFAAPAAQRTPVGVHRYLGNNEWETLSETTPQPGGRSSLLLRRLWKRLLHRGRPHR